MLTRVLSVPPRPPAPRRASLSAPRGSQGRRGTGGEVREEQRKPRDRLGDVRSHRGLPPPGIRLEEVEYKSGCTSGWD